MGVTFVVFSQSEHHKTDTMKKRYIRFLVVLTVCLHPELSRGQGQYGLSDVYTQASLDVARLSLTGPSYENFKANYNTYGFNAGLYLNPIGAGRRLRDDYNLPDNSLRNARLAPLLASIKNQPGPTAPDPKAGSEFLSHLSPLIGIQLIGKGGKYSDRFGTSTTHMTYLEIPVYVLYSHLLPEGKGRLFGGLGFYLAYGLWGKSSYVDGTGATGSFGAFDINGGGYKRFDTGLNFMAGYQLPQGLRLSLVHELGLTSIDPVARADKTKNRVWSLNVGYPLKKLTDRLQKK